jgi:glutathione peroxidase
MNLLKLISVSTLTMLTLFTTLFNQKNKTMTPKTIYDYSINNINGEKIDFKKFEGKKILIVNVASECGFTKQYADLQKLHETYKEKLVVIGVPCNQFGGQEPGTLVEIKSFCQQNYGVTFTLTEKIAVKGDHQHPLYAWLTKKENNGKLNSSVKWNFQKYLIDEKGELIDVFYSITNPMSSKITKLI